MSLEIIAKAASNKAVLDKMQKGANGIEWQLISKGNITVEEIILPIVNVHTLLSNPLDICLDKALNSYLGIGDIKSYKYLTEALELANSLGMRQNKRINVITHLYFSDLVQKDNTWKEWLEYLLEKYNYCNILIENSSTFFKTGRVRNMTAPDIVPNMILKLQSIISDKYKERLGTVLDICHMLNSIRVSNILFNSDKLYDNTVDEREQILKYFEHYSSTCLTVHFNNCYGLGLLGKNHGCIFESSEYNLFDYLMRNYMKYMKKANLVLEVYEEDVDNAYNFEKLAYMIRNWEKDYVQSSVD